MPFFPLLFFPLIDVCGRHPFHSFPLQGRDKKGGWEREWKGGRTNRIVPSNRVRFVEGAVRRGTLTLIRTEFQETYAWPTFTVEIHQNINRCHGICQNTDKILSNLIYTRTRRCSYFFPIDSTFTEYLIFSLIPSPLPSATQTRTISPYSRF